MIDACNLCASITKEAAMNAVPKKATNLSISADLVDEARKLGINLSRTLEVALAAEVKRHREDEWREQNREAIAAYGRFTEKHGHFSDSFRSFMRED
jgi:antitoxin CcdA